MNCRRVLACALAAAAVVLSGAASAADALKVTIGQRGNWDSAVVHLGVKAGIFQKHGLDMESLYTSGSGETLQPVIAGGVELGIAVGTLGAIAAYAKGAPVRIVGAQATGAADYWYAEGVLANPQLEGRRRQDDRVFDKRIFNPQCRARVHQGVRPRREAHRDRQSVFHAHRGHDAPGGRGLGRAAVRFEGNERRQDPVDRPGD